jgi:hypothetical protein
MMRREIMTELKGGCLCGAMRYLLRAEPIFSGVCHCRDCQYVSGGAPAYVMIFPKASLRLTKGAPRAYWSTADSGNRVARSFCEACGTPLFAENGSREEFVAVKVGSLNDPGAFKPAGHIWTQSAQPWHSIYTSLPRWNKDPS